MCLELWFLVLLFTAGYTIVTHTTLFAIKGSNNKKQTKQRKRSEINHCKISETQQDNTIQY